MGYAMATYQQAVEPYSVVHETHTGLVALVGDLAYKVKKPIRTDFLDCSTQQRRGRALQRELELNRRLASASYLGVAHLSAEWASTREPVLVMKRHPDSSRLATMVRRDQPVTDPLEKIAEMLARFHESAERGRPVEAQGTAAAVQARWDANIAELQQFVGTVVDQHRLDAVERLAGQFIAGRALLFAGRVRDRRIVDGHGDLLADDIFCLPEGPEILDCLEFDDNLRYVDTIDDAAFLAMDWSSSAAKTSASSSWITTASWPPIRHHSHSRISTSPTARWFGPRSTASGSRRDIATPPWTHRATWIGCARARRGSVGKIEIGPK